MYTLLRITILTVLIGLPMQPWSVPSMLPSPGVGETAPDMVGQGPDGEIYRLSDLEGYVVLIDFWASWCGPCRKENPNLVSAWEKYRKRDFKNAKGFKIFSVSLDKAKESWVKAIKADKLDWDEHISDLKGWGSQYSRAYGVNSIPDNFLIGPDGKILAKKLRGIYLHYELEKIVED